MEERVGSRYARGRGGLVFEPGAARGTASAGRASLPTAPAEADECQCEILGVARAGDAWVDDGGIAEPGRSGRCRRQGRARW